MRSAEGDDQNTINTGVEKYLHAVSVLVQGAVLSPQSSVQNQRYHATG